MEKNEKLSHAITELDNLMDYYEAVLRKRFPYKPKNRDFSSVVSSSGSEFMKAYKEKTEEKKEEIKPPVMQKSPAVNNDFSNLDMDRLQFEVQNCSRCGLCRSRTNTVFGEGCTYKPLVMVIGEGPGEKEDLSGRPFVGPAGEFLDKWLAAIGLSRQTNTYIANIVKCRPPQNRDPLDEEKEACKAFLYQQIALVMPKAILCVGKPASMLMTGKTDVTMASLRQKLFLYDYSIPMVCTYHPAAVLRNLEWKAPVWEDLKRLRSIIFPPVRG